jgi:hypothetical protein
MPIILAMALACLFLPVQGAIGETQSPPAEAAPAAPETAGVEELIRVLLENGALKQEQVETMMQQKGAPGFSALSALTEMLRANGVITPAQAERVAKKAAAPRQGIALHYEPSRKDLEAMAETVTSEIEGDFRQQVKEEVEQEVLRETKQEIQAAAAPEWTKRIRFSGDIRLRYEGDFFSKNNGEFLNPSSPTELLNSQIERDRFGLRARLGATADLVDNVEVGMRLTTGEASNPVSTNQTMGTYFGKYGVTLDLAYLKLTPLPGLTLIGGRIPNPWFFTDLVWYRDLTFEGFSGTYQARLSDSLQPFLTLGAFPLQEIELSTQDKYLFGGQVGLDIKPRKEYSARIAAAFYDYVNTRGIANNPAYPDEYDYTAPEFEQKGNTLFDIQPSTTTPLYALAANYRELNITGSFDMAFWDPVHVVLIGDYVTNLGFDQQSVERLTGNPYVPVQTQGYLVGLTVGYPEIKRRWDWRFFGYYKYLGADAVLDAFTDPDFHTGGTNAKGWVLGGDLGVGRDLWASLKWVTTNEIKGPPFAVDSLFVDLNYRF